MLCSGAPKRHLTHFVCTDSSNEVESQDQPVTAAGQDVQSEATEDTYDPEEELEQTTGPSLNDTFIL